MLDEALVFCIKISQKQWIDKLQAGSAWFGAINNYIEEAETSNNNEQGDRFEGVFARCKQNNPIIQLYREKFGDDLEIIPDGEYCLLRRTSSRYLHAFCMYGIKNSDIKQIEDIQFVDGSYRGRFRYEIDSKMYTGFLQDGSDASQVAGYYCSAGHINDAIERSLRAKKCQWRRSVVEYDIDLSSEFIIDPLPHYPELWHKRKDLAYQHETRILVYDGEHNSKGFSLDFDVIPECSGNFAIGELYIEGTAILNIIDN